MIEMDYAKNYRRGKAFEGCRRYRVYHKQGARQFLCVALARSETHALKIARDHGLGLERTAYAVLEDV